MMLFILQIAFPLLAADSCQKTIGALDVGSGSVKGVVAVVDVCKGKLGDVLYRGQRSGEFGESLEKSSDEMFPAKVLEQEAEKIKDLVTEMKGKKPEKISGLATAAFRKAKNGLAAAEMIAKRIEVSIEVLSQEKEAEIGVMSAMAAKRIPLAERKGLAVLDIGGGSMQMTAWEGKKPKTFNGDWASIAFKNDIIAKIQSRDPKKVSSPNPIGKNWKKAVAMAEDYGKKNITLPKDVGRLRWIGIGGVLAFSAQQQVAPEKDRFTRKDLEATLKKRSGLSDKKLKSDYAATDVSNLALVLGLMKALGIEEIETAKVSLAEGWLIRSAGPE